MAGTITTERRASARRRVLTNTGLERARLRPGRTARVIDRSTGGALIETDWRVLPGMRVDVQLGDPAPLFRISARIVRCHVVTLERERIHYRAALMFEGDIAVGEVATHGVSPGT